MTTINVNIIMYMRVSFVVIFVKTLLGARLIRFPLFDVNVYLFIFYLFTEKTFRGLLSIIYYLRVKVLGLRSFFYPTESKWETTMTVRRNIIGRDG